jgi:hypothetical protein
MSGKNKTPLLGWHPRSAEDLAWVREEAERRGGRDKGALARLLDEALADLRAKHEYAAPAAGGKQQPASRRVHALTCKCGTCKPKEGSR